MTVLPARLALLVSGVLMAPPADLDLYGLAEHPDTADVASESVSAPVAWPAVPCAGFVEVDLVASVPAGVTFVAETSPDGVTWSTLATPPAGPGVTRQPYPLAGAAWLRGHVTAVASPGAVMAAALLQ